MRSRGKTEKDSDWNADSSAVLGLLVLDLHGRDGDPAQAASYMNLLWQNELTLQLQCFGTVHKRKHAHDGKALQPRALPHAVKQFQTPGEMGRR